MQLIVATSEAELVRLDKLYQRGVANGVKDLSYMSPAEFAKVYPCLCENISHDTSEPQFQLFIKSLVEFRKVCMTAVYPQVYMRVCISKNDGCPRACIRTHINTTRACAHTHVALHYSGVGVGSISKECARVWLCVSLACSLACSLSLARARARAHTHTLSFTHTHTRWSQTVMGWLRFVGSIKL